MLKENKNNDFIEQFLSFRVSLRHTFNMSVVLLSMEGQKALGYHQKYLITEFSDFGELFL